MHVSAYMTMGGAPASGDSTAGSTASVGGAVSMAGSVAVETDWGAALTPSLVSIGAAAMTGSAFSACTNYDQFCYGG